MHGYLAQELGDRAAVYSAGVETHGVNPRAVAVMAEDGVDIAHHTSNHVDEYAAVPFDYVITVCDHANEVCPVFPSSARKLHHNFPDPAKATGTEAEIMAQFRQRARPGEGLRPRLRADAISGATRYQNAPHRTQLSSPDGSGLKVRDFLFQLSVLLSMTAPSPRAAHWPAVRAIYAEGMATGNATFATEPPTWEAWNAGHLPTCRLVAADDAAPATVLGWAALSPVSSRCVYGGVAEVSVYVAAAARGRGVGRALLAGIGSRIGTTPACGPCRPAFSPKTRPACGCTKPWASGWWGAASASASCAARGATPCCWSAAAPWWAPPMPPEPA